MLGSMSWRTNASHAAYGPRRAHQPTLTATAARGTLSVVRAMPEDLAVSAVSRPMLQRRGRIRVLDTVRLLEDLSERKAKRGKLGTVLEILAALVYAVEFSDDDG